MSQATTCHHGKAWAQGQDPDCEECRALRLAFVRAALGGLCANSAMTEGEWSAIPRMAVQVADRTLREVGAQR